MAYKSKLFGYDVKDEAARNDLSEVGAYIGYPDDNVLGLEADFENSTFNRLGAAVNARNRYIGARLIKV